MRLSALAAAAATTNASSLSLPLIEQGAPAFPSEGSSSSSSSSSSVSSSGLLSLYPCFYNNTYVEQPSDGLKKLDNISKEMFAKMALAAKACGICDNENYFVVILLCGEISSSIVEIQSILDKGHDINASISVLRGDTMRHIAQRYGRNDIVSFLIFKGADRNVKNKKGKAAHCIGSLRNDPRFMKDCEHPMLAVLALDMLGAEIVKEESQPTMNEKKSPGTFDYLFGWLR